MQTATLSLPLSGNTYPVRERIREMGGIWNAAAKTWFVPASRHGEAQRLVDAAPKSAYEPRKTRSKYARFAGGGEWTQNRRGRCEDAPCCGCCS